MTAEHSPSDDQLDGARLRRVLGHIPTSVVVITTTVDGDMHGATVGSFASVSLDPPLIAFFLGASSDTLAALEGADHFVVNVLTAAQRELCMAFAKRGTDKFGSLAITTDDAGQPCLPDPLALVHCDVQSITDAGDHRMVLGRIRALDVLQPDAPPLVFWRGDLYDLG